MLTLSPRLRGMLKPVGAVMLGLVAFATLRTFVAQGFMVTSNSMENTLLPGDVILVSRSVARTQLPVLGAQVGGYSSVRRCDIVLFQLPGAGNVTFAKRVIGMPGDTLRMEKRRLYLNGTLLPEPYVKPDTSRDASDAKMVWQSPFIPLPSRTESYSPTRDNWGPLVVPPNRYFVMGDRRAESLDSRYWGFLHDQHVQGRAARILISRPREPDTGSVRWERTLAPLKCEGPTTTREARLPARTPPRGSG